MEDAFSNVAVFDNRIAIPPPQFSPAAGAVVDFLGVVREMENGAAITGLDYEAHREMAQYQFEKIANDAREKFGCEMIVLHHRIGFVPVAEPSLFVRVTAPHRGAAFAACQWIVEELKKVRAYLEETDPQGHGRSRMNWANRLTVARFFLTLIFVAALSCKFPFNDTLALGLFIVAGVTDYADGEIARRCGMITDFGKLMDPLIDKIMIAAGFICLVPIGAIPAWAVIIIISREFLITGLRLLALSKGQVLAAESLGKHKTAWQISTVIYFLALLSTSEFFEWDKTGLPVGFDIAWNRGGTILILITVMLTLVSGVGYLWKNRAVIQMR